MENTNITTVATGNPADVADRVSKIRNIRNSLVEECKQHYGIVQEILKALEENGGVPDELVTLLNPAPEKKVKRGKRRDGPTNADIVRQLIRETQKDGKADSADVRARAEKKGVKWPHSVLAQLSERKEIKLGDGVITVLSGFKKEITEVPVNA